VRAEQNGDPRLLKERTFTLVPRTRSSHQNCRESSCELRVQSGTRIITFASVLRFRSSHRSMPQAQANFGIGTLAADNEAERRDRDLANAARLAAKRLAERQQSPGYWLTMFTDAARFDHPRQEMNTFVNAMMLDVAAPVAEAAGLSGML